MNRTSPIDSALQAVEGQRKLVNQMTVLASCTDSVETPLQLIDLSCLNRFGIKGSGAASWLLEQGISLPDQPNCWLPMQGGLVARLGLSEFLIEDGLAGQMVQNLNQQSFGQHSFPAMVYPVPRQDLAIALWGDPVYDLLAQTCGVNLRAQAQRSVLLTVVVGVTVTLLLDERAGQPLCRLWCDGSFGEYVWRTLLDIATELDGGIVGIDRWIYLDSLRSDAHDTP